MYQSLNHQIGQQHHLISPVNKLLYFQIQPDQHAKYTGGGTVTEYSSSQPS